MGMQLKIPCIGFAEWIYNKQSLALAAARDVEDSPVFEVHAARFRKLDAAADVLAEYQAECARSIAMEEKIRAEH